MYEGQCSLSRRTCLALAGSSLSGLAGCTSTDDGTSTMTPSSQTQKTSNAVARMESELATVEFDGSYFDTHAHWQPELGPNVPAEYASMMEKYDIGATVLFSPSARASRQYESFLETLTEPGVNYLPFMGAPPPGKRLPVELRQLYDGHEQTFWGIGEYKPQEQTFDFDGQRLTQLWELAAELDIPVMYHPNEGQEGTVEPAFASNPDTTFILHGEIKNYGQERTGLGPTLPRLLREYDNLYFQMDVTTMTDGSLLRFGSAQEFSRWYNSNADMFVRLNQNVLSRLLDAAPSRILWGTDVARNWNTNDEAFSLVMDFTERVLEGIPEKHHDPYKYENALSLFGLSTDS